MRKLFFIIGLILIITSCKPIIYKDVYTGVFYGGNEIVIQDRNIGARSKKKKGNYFAYNKAQKKCPQGYHIMTYSEGRSLLSDPRYNTVDKIINDTSNIHLPITGFIPYKKYGCRLVAKRKAAYYHLADSIAPNENMYLYFSQDSTIVFAINYKRKYKDRMNVRCVKNKPRLPMR